MCDYVCISSYHTWEILEWEKIGEFDELWDICQYITCQFFLLVILLATEVTKQLPFNSLNVHTVLITAPAYQLSYLLILTLNASCNYLLRSCPSTGSILHDESWHKQSK